MCGRFTQNYTWAQLHALMTLTTPPRNLRARYNIAPTTTVDVLRQAGDGLELVPMRWGLIPMWWSKPAKEVPATFNARAETVATKPMFRSAYRSRRCIVPASGFYEWTGGKGEKTPHYFTRADGQVLAFAGLWEQWHDRVADERVMSCTIVVSSANDWMVRYHDRMPIVVPADLTDAWLAGHAGGEVLASPRPDMCEWIVSKRVNRTGVGDDDPTMIEPEADPII